MSPPRAASSSRHPSRPPSTPPCTLWSLKGGAGVTVIAATMASLAARQGPTLLVDLCGDAPAALGMAEPSGPGVWDWLRTEHREPDALRRLSVPVGQDWELLPAGSAGPGPRPARAGDDLFRALAARDAQVIIDAGCALSADRPGVDAVRAVLLDRGRSLLVARACYLGLRRAARGGWRADGVVVVTEPGRSLAARDVADVLGAPVLAEVTLDPAVARAVDAGLLVRRVPRVLARSLDELW